MTAPILYLPHGGGPLPLLDDPAHRNLTRFLRGIGSAMPKPAAVVLVSAHWESRAVALNAARAPALLFDYYGFPPASYAFTYPAPGAPALAADIAGMLQSAGFACELETERGYDHGVFVPLKLIYPEADVPIVQLSLVEGLDPATHIRLGRALAPLGERNVALIGSGMSFHNLRAIRLGEHPELRAASDAFDAWLVQTVAGEGLTMERRAAVLEHWSDATGARFCHPREEHLLPLHVCFGAASALGKPGRLLFNDALLGHRVSAFGW